MRSTLLFVCLLVILSVQAQYQFDTIQVSSTQVPMKLSETGKNITIISSQQIEAIPATSLDEILQTVTGVEVQSRSGFGVQGDILMRGATYTQVLILVDGMRLNDPLTGHFNSYIPVTPAEIYRIEILRGAAAAMYGADAVGGIINIITKTFANSDEGIQLSGTLNYGEHKLVNGYQGFQVKKGKTTFGGGFSMNQSPGETFPEKVIDTSTTLESYQSYFDIKTLGVSFAHDFNERFSIRARSAYDYRDFNARYFYTTSPFDKSTEITANWWNHVQLLRTTNSSSTDFNIAYKYNTDEFIFSPDFPSTNNHITQLTNVTLNHLQILNDRITVKGGIQLDQRKIESNDRGDHEDIHLGFYTMGVYRNNGLNLSLSLRGDYDENYEFEFSPQLNVSYVLSSIVIRGSAGRSIRAADYTERYVSNNLQDLTPGRSLGNPDLLAESSWSEEIGADIQLSKEWKFSTTLFARQSDNLIDYVSTNQSEIGSVSKTGSLQENADYFFTKNITDVNTQGVEAEINFTKPLSQSGAIQWTLGYTFLNTTNSDDVISVYISSHARHLLTTNIQLNWNHFDVAISGLYKQRTAQIASGIDSELADSYDVWNARAGIRLSENFSLNIQVRNMFDQSYQNILGAPMPGRWLMGGVKWSL